MPGILGRNNKFSNFLTMGNGASQNGVEISPFVLEIHREHNGGINCMALSDDNQMLATGSDDNTLKLWASGNGSKKEGYNMSMTSCIGTMAGHEKYITCVVVEENCILSGSADKTIKKWDLGNMQCVYTFEGHIGMINRIMCTGDFVISSSYDTTARLWSFDPAPGCDPCIRIFKGHTKGVYPLVFVPADDDWRLEDPEICDLLITGSTDNTARSWSIETGKCLKVFRGHNAPVHSLAIDSEGRTLYSGSGDSTIRSWDIVKGQLLKEFEGHEQAITTMILVGKFMFTGSADRTARSWVVEFGDCARTFRGHKQAVSCLAFSDGIVYTGCGDGTIRAFEAKSGTLRRRFKGHTSSINCLKIANGKLFSGSFDSSLIVWSLADIKTSSNADKPNKNSQIGRQTKMKFGSTGNLRKTVHNQDGHISN